MEGHLGKLLIALKLLALRWWDIRKGIALSDVPVELDATLEVHYSTDSLPHLHKFIASSAQDSLPLLPFASASAPINLWLQQSTKLIYHLNWTVNL